MKRLIVCCDGTWQSLTSEYPTNVVKMAQAIKPTSKDGIPQIVFYDAGVGSGNMAEKLFAEGDKILGGAFGIGIDNVIQDAYRFLSLNYDKGDEIYLFGFSRGAYTVRSLAGLIRYSGGLLPLPKIREAPLTYELYRDAQLTLKEKEQFRKLPIPCKYRDNVQQVEECRKKAHDIYRDRSRVSWEELKEKGEETPEAKADLQIKIDQVQKLLSQYNLHERVETDIRRPVYITLLACWDTVGSLGVPKTVPFLSNWVNEKYAFHDDKLSSIIRNALHAVAIDENREVFNVTEMAQKPEHKDNGQRLRQVWFPGWHGCVGGGDHRDQQLADAALVWMMDQISEFGLGLDFERDAVEDCIAPDHTGNATPPKWYYDVLGVNPRDMSKVPFSDVHESAKKRWRDCGYRPQNLTALYETELNAWCQQNPRSADLALEPAHL